MAVESESPEVVALRVSIISDIQDFVQGLDKATNFTGSFTRKFTEEIKKTSKGVSDAVKSGGDIFKKGITESNSMIRSLTRDVMRLVSIGAMIKFGKEAVKAGEELSGYQNIIDRTFGRSVEMLNEFAETSAAAYGISEKSAKKYAAAMGTMFRTAGITGNPAAEMTLEMEKLSADLGSFYNRDTDSTFNALKSAINGSTGAVKELGINMSEANMQQYAYRTGHAKLYQQMTESEKMMLRYNYILESTASIQGDFEKSSGNWNNQIKLLRAQLEDLTATLGQGLMNALRPALIFLNEFIAKLVQFAKEFRNFTQVIWGNASATNATATMADNLEQANQNAKALKSSLQGFDELNILSLPSEFTNDASAVTDYSSQTGEVSNEFAQALLAGDWKKAGNIIAQKINEGIDSIDTGIGTKVAEIFNGVLSTIQETMDTIEFEELGSKIGTTISNFFNDKEKGLLGETIASFVNGAVDFAYGILNDTDAGLIGEHLAADVNGFVGKIDWERIGQEIVLIPKKLWELLDSAFLELDGGTLGGAIADLFGGFFEELGFDPETIKEMKKDVADFIGEIVSAAQNAYSQIKPFIDDIVKIFAEIWKYLYERFAGPQMSAMSGIWVNAFGLIKDAVQTVEGVLNIILGILKGDTSTILLGIIDVVAGVVNGALRLWYSFEQLTLSVFSVIATAVADVLGVAISKPLKSLSDTFAAINKVTNWEWTKKWADALGGAASATADWGKDVSEWTETLIQQSKDNCEEVTGFISNLAEKAKEAVKPDDTTSDSWKREGIASSSSFADPFEVRSLGIKANVSPPGVSGLWGNEGSADANSFKAPLAGMGIGSTITPPNVAGKWGEEGGRDASAFENPIKNMGLTSDITPPNVTSSWQGAGNSAGFGFKANLAIGSAGYLNLIKPDNSVAAKFGDIGKQSGQRFAAELAGAVKVDISPSLTGNGLNMQDKNTRYNNIVNGLQLVGKVSKAANGGIFEQGSLILAGEVPGQTEILGSINGKTGVASGQEITGIADAVNRNGEANNELLRQLIYAVESKNLTISPSATLGGVIKTSQRMYQSVTG